MIIHSLGHKAPKIPHRTLALKRFTAPFIALPPYVSLEYLCTPIEDQTTTSACTGYSSAGIVGILSNRQIRDGVWQGPVLIASALGIYACARELEGTLDQDEGASIADVVKAMKQGVVTEADWPSDPNCVLDAPSASAMADSIRVTLADAAPIFNDHDTLHQCLAQGFPIHLGVQVYDSFMAAFQPGMSGDVPMPNPSLESLLGGHAIAIVGYDDTTKRYRFRNSWGADVGDHGYGTLPYAFVEDQLLATELYEPRRLLQS